VHGPRPFDEGLHGGFEGDVPQDSAHLESDDGVPQGCLRALLTTL